MSKGVRLHGSTWQYTIDYGRQPCQRCIDCNRRQWITGRRHRACPHCGGRMLDRIERRQQSRGGFRTKRQAEQARAETLAAVRGGSYVETTKQTLGEYLLDDWLPARKPRQGRQGRGHRGHLGAGTWTTYRDDLRAHVVPRIGQVPLRALTAAHLNELYDALEEAGGQRGQGLSPKTVLNVHRVLHKALADAVKQGRVARNVADFVDSPSAAQARTRVWSIEELRAFLQHVRGDRLYAAWLLFATTGMRRGEVAGLAWDDVDLHAGSLRVDWTLGMVDGKPTWKPRPKSDAGQRRMALDPATVEALRSYRTAQAQERLLVGPAWESQQRDSAGRYRENVVFTWQDGRLISPERFSRWFQKHCRAAGLPTIRLHDIRHTYATAGLAAASGWHDVKVISQRLGHANVAITLDTYAHVLPVADQHTADTLARVILGDAR